MLWRRVLACTYPPASRASFTSPWARPLQAPAGTPLPVPHDVRAKATNAEPNRGAPLEPNDDGMPPANPQQCTLFICSGALRTRSASAACGMSRGAAVSSHSKSLRDLGAPPHATDDATPVHATHFAFPSQPHHHLGPAQKLCPPSHTSPCTGSRRSAWLPAERAFIPLHLSPTRRP